MKKEKDTISNEIHELEYVAKKMGVETSEVLRAKEVTGSNDRKTIETYLLQHKKYNQK